MLRGIRGVVGMGLEGELKRRGLAACIQNPYGARPSNRLPTTSICFRLLVSLGLTHVQHGLKLISIKRKVIM